MSEDKPLICLVEDDPIMGESLRDRFLLEGFAVDWHQLASSALEALRRNRYALIISDIRLPDTSGEELVYEDGAAQPRPIETGLRTAETVEVIRGLEAGDRPVVTAIQRLRPGLPLTLEEER